MEILSKNASKYANQCNMIYHEVSALNGKNIELAIKELVLKVVQTQQSKLSYKLDAISEITLEELSDEENISNNNNNDNNNCALMSCNLI